MASRPFVDIIFGEYAPDFGGMPRADDPGYLVDALGVRVTPNGYRAQPSFTSFGNAVGTTTNLGTCAAILTDISGLDFFAITNSIQIHQSSDLGVSWSNVSPAAATVNTKTQIVQWDRSVILINLSGLAYKDMVGATATQFVVIPDAATGGVAGATVGARVRDHLVVGNVNTGFDQLPYTVQWCAIGDFTDWPTPGTSEALAKEAGTQDLTSAFGAITGILGGEKFGIVVQQFGLTRMTYVGGSTVYEFDTYEKKVGSGAESSDAGAGRVPFVQVGPSLWVWTNEQGCFVTDGYSVQPVSSGKIDEALFLDSISHDSGPLLRAGRGVYDERRGHVILTTKGGSSADQSLCYDVKTGAFTFCTGTDYNILFNGPASATDLTRTIYALGTDRILRKRTAAAGAIALQTGYIELVPGNNVQVTGAHLLGAGVPGSLALSYKATSSLGSVDVAQTGFTSLIAPTRGMKSTGRPPNNQFFSFRVTGTGAESQLIRGIRVYYENAEPAT